MALLGSKNSDKYEHAVPELDPGEVGEVVEVREPGLHDAGVGSIDFDDFEAPEETQTRLTSSIVSARCCKRQTSETSGSVNQSLGKMSFVGENNKGLSHPR